MELFQRAIKVRLRSYHSKYLTADDDEKHVSQGHDGSAAAACWTIELVKDVPDVFCLRSLYGRYLTAANEHFLLGVTSKKVLQTFPSRLNSSVVWEPVREGIQVKLKTSYGHYLRANNGALPWRNSVTHDVPHGTAFHEWIFWDVEILETQPTCPTPPLFSTSTSLSKLKLFHLVKTIRLRGHQGKYLTADIDEKHVTQGHDGAAASAHWTVELVGDNPLVLRLLSCYNRYLTATDESFFLGITGKKVLQSHSARLDSSVEWEPIGEGLHFKFRTLYGHYLRANGGPPPWRNSVTHDVPHSKDWNLWDVEIVEVQPQLPLQTPTRPETETEHHPVSPQPTNATHSEELSPAPARPHRSLSSSTTVSDSSSDDQSSSLLDPIPRVQGQRSIFYTVADDDGNVDDSAVWLHLNFTGTSLSGLTEVLEEETGLDGIFLCTRNFPSKQLIPLWLQLPPSNQDIWLVVVDSNSTVGRSFMTLGKMAAELNPNS